MKLDVSWGFWTARTYYYVRVRGWVADVARGARRLDTKERVPEEWFRKANCPADQQTPRGDKIAASYAASRERELNDAGAWKPRRMTLRELGDYRLGLRQNEVSIDTIDRERGWLDALCKHLGDDCDPSQLEIGSIERFRDLRLQDTWIPRLGTKGVRPISPRTVFNECAYASSLVSWGYARRKDTGMTELNLTEVPMIAGKEGRGGARKPSIEEFWRLYEKASLRPRVGVKSQVILALGFATWLRLDALLNLRREWIDFEARTVTVPKEFMKGGKVDLTLPLNNFALDAIKRALELHRGASYVLPVNPRTGKPSVNLFHTLRAIATDAGARPISLHGLRKLGASTILNHRCDETHKSGVSKIVSDRILAHALPQNDEAYYNVEIETMRDALSIIDEEWATYLKSRGNVLQFAARG